MSLAVHTASKLDIQVFVKVRYKMFDVEKVSFLFCTCTFAAEVLKYKQT